MRSIPFWLLFSVLLQSCDTAGDWKPLEQDEKGWLAALFDDNAVVRSSGGVSTRVRGRWTLGRSWFTVNVDNKQGGETVSDLSGVVLKVARSPSDFEVKKVAVMYLPPSERIYPGPDCECFAPRVKQAGNDEAAYYDSLPLRISPGKSAVFRFEFDVYSKNRTAELEIPVIIGGRVMHLKYSFTSF